MISRRLILGAGAGAAVAFGQSRVRDVQVQVLSTMLSGTYTGEWGFSAHVSIDGRPLLFDTGNRPETVLNNARELKTDLSVVENVLLSHNHGDHTGGLVTLRRDVMGRNPKALSVAYGGQGIMARRKPASAMTLTGADFVKTGGRLVQVDKPLELHPNAWITGPIPRVHNERNWSGSGLVRADDREQEDNVPEDQALVIHTTQGLVVVCGCGHAGIVNTLTYARKLTGNAPLYAVIGGFHLFNAKPETIEWTAAQLRPWQIQYFLAAHCTGIEATHKLRELLAIPAERMAVAAVGQRFQSGKGILGGLP